MKETTLTSQTLAAFGAMTMVVGLGIIGWGAYQAFRGNYATLLTLVVIGSVAVLSAAALIGFGQLLDDLRAIRIAAQRPTVR